MSTRRKDTTVKAIREIPAGLQLQTGSHTPDGTFCLLELSAWLAGEPWSDSPACVSRVLASYGRQLNDRMPDNQRQRLLPFAVRLIGTAAPFPVELRRAYALADYAVRIIAPLALEARGYVEHAATLRTLASIVDRETAAAACAACAAYAAAAYAASAYAAASAYDAAAYAAAACAAADAAYDAAAYASAYAAAAAYDAAAYAAAAYASADAYDAAACAAAAYDAGPVWDASIAAFEAALAITEAVTP